VVGRPREELFHPQFLKEVYTKEMGKRNRESMTGNEPRAYGSLAESSFSASSVTNHPMKEPSRNIDRKKVFPGVLFLCVAVLLMLMGKENASPLWQVVWVSLLGLGLFLYLWGRFYSKGGD
jgi:hypothetical protein